MKPVALFTGSTRPPLPISRSALARSIRAWRACGVQLRRYPRTDGHAYVIQHADGESAVAMVVRK